MDAFEYQACLNEQSSSKAMKLSICGGAKDGATWRTHTWRVYWAEYGDLPHSCGGDHFPGYLHPAVSPSTLKQHGIDASSGSPKFAALESTITVGPSMTEVNVSQWCQRIDSYFSVPDCSRDHCNRNIRISCANSQKVLAGWDSHLKITSVDPLCPILVRIDEHSPTPHIAQPVVKSGDGWYHVVGYCFEKCLVHAPWDASVTWDERDNAYDEDGAFVGKQFAKGTPTLTGFLHHRSVGPFSAVSMAASGKAYGLALPSPHMLVSEFLIPTDVLELHVVSMAGGKLTFTKPDEDDVSVSLSIDEEVSSTSIGIGKEVKTYVCSRNADDERQVFCPYT